MYFPSTLKSIAIYNASFGTRELAPALLCVLRSVHKKPWLISTVDRLEYGRDDVLYIIICPAGLGIQEVRMPKYYISWQLEFLIGVYNVPPYINRLRGAVANWDYSKLNIGVSLTRDGINSLYVPPGYNETVAMPDILKGDYVYTDMGKDIDVVFLGYCDAYPRRIKIREQLLESGLKIYFPTGLDTEGMKQAIRRSKICLNMAAQDVFVLAQVRMNLLLSNYACIVSETSADPQDDILYQQSGTRFVPYERLIEEIKILLPDFERRREIAVQSYQWYKNHRYWSDIVDFNSLLPSL